MGYNLKVKRVCIFHCLSFFQTWHNHKGFHSLPTYLNVMNNAILRANLDPSIHGNPSAYGISVINQPMNKTSSTMLDDYS